MAGVGGSRRPDSGRTHRGSDHSGMSTYRHVARCMPHTAGRPSLRRLQHLAGRPVSAEDVPGDSRKIIFFGCLRWRERGSWRSASTKAWPALEGPKRRGWRPDAMRTVQNCVQTCGHTSLEGSCPDGGNTVPAGLYLCGGPPGRLEKNHVFGLPAMERAR